MARYYSTLDNSTVSALEADASNMRFQRVPFVGSGPTLKSNALSARASLDAALRSQIDAANNNGDAGVIVPRDAMSRGASNISISNLYTHPEAEYPADPRTRPTDDILIADATPVSPTDALTLANSIYDAAVAAVTALITGTGIYDRLGADPDRTMRSLWHDLAMTYFGWDTFTPEQVTEYPVHPVPLTYSPELPGHGDPMTFTLNFGFEHPTDAAEAYVDYEIIVAATGPNGTPDDSVEGDGTVSDYTTSGTVGPGVNTAGVTLPSGLKSGYFYRFYGAATLRYADGTEGETFTFTQVNFSVEGS